MDLIGVYEEGRGVTLLQARGAHTVSWRVVEDALDPVDCLKYGRLPEQVWREAVRAALEEAACALVPTPGEPLAVFVRRVRQLSASSPSLSEIQTRWREHQPTNKRNV